MILSTISIKRPVLATVLNLIIIFVGIISYSKLSVREYPNIDVPMVTVETRYPGANAHIIESQVTTPLEDSLSGIEGIDYISSISRPEESQITLKFLQDRDPNIAISDVRDRVNRIRDRLPTDVKEPVISKVEADAQPIIWLALSSDQHTALQVTEYADRFVKDRLQTIPGIADIIIFGERKYAMRIWLDANKMAAYQLSTQAIERALRQQNLDIPAGRIESIEREFTVLSSTNINTPPEFEQIILKRTPESLVRMKDVAKVELGAEDERQIARFKGKGAVGLGIVKQSTANPLELSQKVQERLPEVIESLPDGMLIQTAYDSSVFIDRSIQSVFRTIIEAIALVIFVIFIALRSWRATLIPLVTIPISLIGAFAFMYFLHFSVNTLTLLAMVLAIGLVVDDAIVVLENIYRHIEEGLEPIEAALKGSEEIGFAIIAMTLTLAAVFTPIAFSTGRTGKLFTEFSLTLACAVIVSGFTALTLSPMMCSRMLNKSVSEGRFYQLGEIYLNKLKDLYSHYLAKALERQNLILGIVLAVLSITGALFATLKSELTPIEDRGIIISMALGPEGATIHYTDQYARQMEAIFATVPEVERYFMAVGFPVVTNAISFVGLVPWEDRDRKQQAIVAALAPRLFTQIPGVLAFPINPPSLGQSVISRAVEFIIQTTDSYEKLQDYVQIIMEKMRTHGGFSNPDTDLKLNKPELDVILNRDKLGLLGIDVETVGRTLETLLEGREVTRFKLNSKEYNVIVKLQDSERRIPEQIGRIYVKGHNDQMIQLSNVTQIKETVSPKELNHFNKLRSATITADLSHSLSLDEALAFLEKTVKNELPKGIQYDFGGVSREFKESATSLTALFIMALIFIYLVLAAQFESFIDPLIILISVPLAMAGALLALLLTGGSLNIYSKIGLITLIGLITKHGILIVEFSNQLLQAGKSLQVAVLEASALRLRPILMTSCAMILGALPLGLATGAGAESRQQIGWVIVGGLFFGTILTLFVIPSLYFRVARGRHS